MTGLHLEAAVFDLDGVVTRTEKVHMAAWKDVFDSFLEPCSDQPFTEDEYLEHVDGRPRRDGVRAFLSSRGIELPEGSPDDPPGAATVFGLGNEKNLLFREHLEVMGAEVDHDAVRVIRELRDADLSVGVATSSKNATLILEKASLGDLFDAQVDGVLSEELDLRGKPEPDIFLECLELLGHTDPARAMVVEDASAGVAAGRAGGFGFVLGVDRGGNAKDLLAHGAHRVIRHFGEVSIEWIEEQLRATSTSPSTDRPTSS